MTLKEANEKYAVILNNFYRWAAGQSIDETTKEEIINELQRCLDANTVDGSPLAGGVFAADFRRYTYRRRIKDKREPELLKTVDPDNYPVELKVFLDEMESRQNSNKLNEVLEKYGYTKIMNNNPEEGMNKLGEIIIDRINQCVVCYCGFEDKETWNDSFLEEVKDYLAPAIKQLDNHSTIAEMLKNTLGKNRNDVQNFVAFYLAKYYFNEIAPIIKEEDIGILENCINYDSSYYGLGTGKEKPKLYFVEDPVFTKNFSRISFHDTAYVCMKKYEKQAEKELKNISSMNHFWKKKSEKELKNVMDTITYAIKNCSNTAKILETPSGYSIDTVVQAQGISNRKFERSFFETLNAPLDIKLFCVQEGIGSVIYAIKDNYVASVSFGVDSRSGKLVGGTRIEYNALCSADVITVWCDENSFSLELPLMQTDSRNASVLGRAAVGVAIGGYAGGIIGAASAAKKNIEIAKNRLNSEPIKINTTSKEIHVGCDCILTGGHILCTDKTPSKYTEMFINELNIARARENDVIKNIELEDEKLRPVIPINTYFRMVLERKDKETSLQKCVSGKDKLEVENNFEQKKKIAIKKKNKKTDVGNIENNTRIKVLEDEYNEINERIKRIERELQEQREQINKQMEKLKSEKMQLTKEQLEYCSQKAHVETLEFQIHCCQYELFLVGNIKRYKLTKRLDSIERPKLKELQGKAEIAEKLKNEKIDAQIKELKNSIPRQKQNELKKLKKRIDDISREIKEVSVECKA